MKLIIDTNVLVSGVFFKGTPYSILHAWKKDKFTLIITHEIIEEYKRVISDMNKNFPNINAEMVLDTIIINSHLSFSIALNKQICEDPDDDKFLAAAIASKTKLIVSGDKHLLNVTGYKGIEIIKPRLFMDKYLSKNTAKEKK